MTPDTEREELLKALTELERENRILKGQIAASTPEVMDGLRARNEELKAALIAAEKALALELRDRKTPIDATGCDDAFEVLKANVLAHCTEKKIDSSLWKKLESL